MTKTAIAWAVLGLVACKDSTPKASAHDAVGTLAGFKDQMCACRDTACAKRVSGAMAAWSKTQPSDKPAAMSADDQKRATELGTQLGECMMRATAGDGSAATPPTATGIVVKPSGKNPEGLPKECDDYKAAIDRIAACDRMNARARETLVKGFEDAAARWASMPDASKATLSTSCAGGTEAVVAIGKTQCGW